MKLTCSDVILGFLSKDIKEQVWLINMIVLYVKNYILKCKYNMSNQYIKYHSICEKGLTKVLEAFRD